MMLRRALCRHVCAPLASVLLLAGGCHKAPPPPPPPPTVRTALVEQRDVTPTFQWLATLDGSTTAEIRPQVTGYIESVDYQEGSVVKAHTLLFSIDRRPFEAARDKALGDYQSAVAQLNKARADVERYTPLVQKRALSKEQLDNARAAVSAGIGNVESAKGLLDAARLNLQWTEVRSPIDGIAGIAEIRVGSLVGSNQVLTVVSTVDPIRASYNISERDYLRWAEFLNHLSDPRVARELGYLELILINGKAFRYRARRVIVNRQIDPTTGTLRVQALFPNPGNILRPGMFAQVRAHSGEVTRALLVPEVAVFELQGLKQVDVVGSDEQVQVRRVTLGRNVDHSFIVERGLAEGERVIVAGMQNVRPGMRVHAVPAAPTPPAGSEQDAGERQNVSGHVSPPPDGGSRGD